MKYANIEELITVAKTLGVDQADINACTGKMEDAQAELAVAVAEKGGVEHVSTALEVGFGGVLSGFQRCANKSPHTAWTEAESDPDKAGEL